METLSEQQQYRRKVLVEEYNFFRSTCCMKDEDIIKSLGYPDLHAMYRVMKRLGIRVEHDGAY